MAGSEEIAFLEAVLCSDPRDVEARVKLGWLYESERHDFNAAVSHLQTALTDDPASAEAGFWLAKVYYHDGAQFEPARDVLERVLRSHPDHVPSLSLLATICREDLNDPARATSLLEHALKLAPSWIILHVEASHAYLELREIGLAAEHATRAAQLAGDFRAVSTAGSYTYYEAAITGRWVDEETLAQLKYRAEHIGK